MPYNSVIISEEFARQAKRLIKKYKSLKQELKDFEQDILADPEQGDPLGSNVYKVRIAIASKGKGKGGGARIITYLYKDKSTIYLLTIFDKNEYDNVSDVYISSIIKNLPL